jgi:Trk-type K+ transport system membrane component
MIKNKFIYLLYKFFLIILCAIFFIVYVKFFCFLFSYINALLCEIQRIVCLNLLALVIILHFTFFQMIKQTQYKKKGMYIFDILEKKKRILQKVSIIYVIGII